jgi:hypothetical protein
VSQGPNPTTPLLDDSPPDPHQPLLVLPRAKRKLGDHSGAYPINDPTTTKLEPQPERPKSNIAINKIISLVLNAQCWVADEDAALCIDMDRFLPRMSDDDTDNGSEPEIDDLSLPRSHRPHPPPTSPVLRPSNK